MSTPNIHPYFMGRKDYEDSKRILYVEVQEGWCDICGFEMKYPTCALDRRQLNPGFRAGHLANLRLLCPSCQEKREPSLIFRA